jgi:GTP cyclohydrolase II
MKKETKRLLGSIALTAGTLGTVLMLRKKGRVARLSEKVNRWARPGMLVTFRAELMPGREPAERTYRILELLPSNRVLLEGVGGEHMRTEFERIR